MKRRRPSQRGDTEICTDKDSKSDQPPVGTGDRTVTDGHETVNAMTWPPALRRRR